MRAWPILLLALCLTACARETAPAVASGSASRAAVDVRVVRDGDRWTAELSFDRAAPAWVFTRSALARTDQKPWRPRSWTVETPGVRLERRGWFDLLVADGGPVPRKVKVRFTPFAGDLLADYDPALVFSDGSVALFSQQFDAFPIESASAAETLPVDLAGAKVTETRMRVTFRDKAGEVLHEGRRRDSVTLEGEGTYVLFGPATPIVSDSMSTIIDPQLPPWLRTALARSTPAILERYRSALGPPPGAKPTIMVSWAGPTKGVTSMGGSVLPGLVVMTFEGDGVLEEDADLRGRGQWFIAHEAAHFWLGQAVRYEYSRDAWITEGGADLLAIRTVAAIDPAYDWKSELQASIDDCAKLSAGRGVASAQERNEHRAYYACGALFALIAESASGRPFTHFVRGLIESNRDDGVIKRAEWLAALDEASADPSLSADIGRLLDNGAADPMAAIASLLARAKVPHRIEPDGRIRLT